jgi:hypothetical protein
MSYIFKYHPDNVIYLNGAYHSTFAEFIEVNPDFPIVEGVFFELKEQSVELIDINGCHTSGNINDFNNVIGAIDGIV